MSVEETPRRSGLLRPAAILLVFAPLGVLFVYFGHMASVDDPEPAASDIYVFYFFTFVGLLCAIVWFQRTTEKLAKVLLSFLIFYYSLPFLFSALEYVL